MKAQKLLFGTRTQAIEYAKLNDWHTEKRDVIVNLKDFQSMEGATETYSGETNAVVARDENDQVVAYLACWE